MIGCRPLKGKQQELCVQRLVHGIDDCLQGEEKQSRFFFGEVNGLVIVLFEKHFDEIAIDEGLTARLDFRHPQQETIVRHFEALEQRFVSVGVTFNGFKGNFFKRLLIRSANAMWPGVTEVFDDLDSGHSRAFLREIE